ncbi:MAG: hypothetical protein COV47_02540 [Candidatus Diapherotrites archaeon CG11_big_fil_rev_8_21_14_0_20_37_9]|nr:MAG: hypothetical protein COV47_02540 [Candidatus Diapherotrites archaeon CG11_big_fil_rev_8_21_14_0_20_37_9]
MVKIEAGNGDFDSLKVLAEKCLANYTLQKSNFKTKSKMKDFVAFFAVESGQKIGFISGYGEGQSMHIWLFGVMETKRRMGIGEALLAEFESFAKQKGYVEITTMTFNKYRGKLILSIKSGFDITGYKFLESKNNYGIELTKKIV